jgi:CubicO group peptidase (beta-lactamase class C family)
MIDLGKRVSPAELVETFRSIPRFPDPWRYSSPGYVLAAQVVEQVADQPYRNFLADRIFAPAGMAATFAGSPDAGAGSPGSPGSPGNGAGSAERGMDIALGHDADGNLVPSWELDVLGMGCGDVWSTTTDMVTWMDALSSGAVLNDPWRTLMVMSQAATGDERERSNGYGYGLFVGSWHGEPWFHHDGMNAGCPQRPAAELHHGGRGDRGGSAGWRAVRTAWRVTAELRSPSPAAVLRGGGDGDQRFTVSPVVALIRAASRTSMLRTASHGSTGTGASPRTAAANAG